ncbi:hypothetical protein [Nostoc sp.]|uniref:hypothetical protein n=1 Tax=Nostoc sp. TaxID=1180 RepID=UPI002FF5B9B2
MKFCILFNPRSLTRNCFAQCPIFLYERLRQRQRYFDPTLGDAARSLLPEGYGKAQGNASLSTNAQCPVVLTFCFLLCF